MAENLYNMSCCQTKLITAAQVRDVTGLSRGVEDRKLLPYIEAAQYHLEKILGTTLYEELETAIEADRTLAGEADLLALFNGYICPFLAWRTLALGAVRLYAEVDRNGIYTKSGDDYTSVDSRTFGMVSSDAKGMADLYSERLIDFLKDNTATYTTYNTVVNGEERIRKAGRHGIVFTRDRWQDPRGLPDYGDRDPSKEVNDSLY